MINKAISRLNLPAIFKYSKELMF